MEWYRQIYREDSTIDKKAKFPYLIKFLCAERDALEYAVSDLRKGEKTVCIHFCTDSHSTADCRTYKNLSIGNKLNVLKEKSACFACFNPGHRLKECTVKSMCGDNCNKFHHPSLHTEVTSGLSNTITDSDSTSCNPEHVLLPAMKVIPDSKRCKSLSCLWDTGADISLIKNLKARH